MTRTWCVRQEKRQMKWFRTSWILVLRMESSQILKCHGWCWYGLEKKCLRLIRKLKWCSTRQVVCQEETLWSEWSCWMAYLEFIAVLDESWELEIFVDYSGVEQKLLAVPAYSQSSCRKELKGTSTKGVQIGHSLNQSTISHISWLLLIGA